MGWPPWLDAKLETDEEVPTCDIDLGSGLGLLEETTVLKVTVRCGLGGVAVNLPVDEPSAMEEIKGVVSVELDAMATRVSLETAIRWKNGSNVWDFKSWLGIEFVGGSRVDG